MSNINHNTGITQNMFLLLKKAQYVTQKTHHTF